MLYQYDDLPKRIRTILDSFDEDSDRYNECERILHELKQEGWHGDYDLAGELCELYPIDF